MINAIKDDKTVHNLGVELQSSLKKPSEPSKIRLVVSKFFSSIENTSFIKGLIGRVSFVVCMFTQLCQQLFNKVFKKPIIAESSQSKPVVTLTEPEQPITSETPKETAEEINKELVLVKPQEELALDIPKVDLEEQENIHQNLEEDLQKALEKNENIQISYSFGKIPEWTKEAFLKTIAITLLSAQLMMPVVKASGKLIYTAAVVSRPYVNKFFILSGSLLKELIENLTKEPPKMIEDTKELPQNATPKKVETGVNRKPVEKIVVESPPIRTSPRKTSAPIKEVNVTPLPKTRAAKVKPSEKVLREEVSPSPAPRRSARLQEKANKKQ